MLSAYRVVDAHRPSWPDRRHDPRRARAPRSCSSSRPAAAPTAAAATAWSGGRTTAASTASCAPTRRRRARARARRRRADRQRRAGFDRDVSSRRSNPALVHVTISAFGGDGPKADWAASDLTILAAGCAQALNGDSDRAPVRTTVPQAWLHAGAEAAVGALLGAHRARSAAGSASTSTSRPSRP